MNLQIYEDFRSIKTDTLGLEASRDATYDLILEHMQCAGSVKLDGTDVACDAFSKAILRKSLKQEN